jgi:hypothetical protein
VRVAGLWIGCVGCYLSLCWCVGDMLLVVDSFCRLCFCLSGFELLNMRFQASLAAANRVTGSDIMFDHWGFTLYLHGGMFVGVLCGVLCGDWCVFC